MSITFAMVIRLLYVFPWRIASSDAAEKCDSACRFINGLKAQGTKTKDAKVLFYGAGSSAVGVANMIATLIQKEGGLSEKEAKEVSLPLLSKMPNTQQASAHTGWQSRSCD